jgi:VanZ family protein
VPALVVVLLGVQLIALYAPSAPGPQTSIPHADKIVHALFFAAPVLAARLGRRPWWTLVALGSLVHAPLSEVVQHTLLDGRSGDGWDVVADLVGVGLASIAVPLTLRRPRRRRL